MRGLFFIFLFGISLFADYIYTFNTSYTDNGESLWNKKILKINISDYNDGVKLEVNKYSGTFTGNGTIYIKVGGYESYSADWDSKNVSTGDSGQTFYFNKTFLDNKPSWNNNQKILYARFENPDGGWAWAGSVTITRKLQSNPINGECGNANNFTFSYNDSSYSSYRNQCNVGNSSNISFPLQGHTENWSCSGFDGGSKAYCSASRENLPSTIDTTNPTGDITSTINNSYVKGDTFSIDIKAEDDTKLQKISFNITDNNNNKINNISSSWSSNLTLFTTSHNIDTSNLNVGTYYYALWVQDASNEAVIVKSGSFTITEPIATDTTKPTGSISTINSTYSKGDKFDISINAEDETKLNIIRFNIVKDGTTQTIETVSKSWETTSTSFSTTHTVDTSNLEVGVYNYVLFVKDSSNNLYEDIRGSFIILEKEDNTKPDLIFYQPDNWDNNIVITNESNCTKINCTESINSIYDNENIFINFLIKNTSKITINNEFKDILYIDNNQILTLDRQTQLKPNYYFPSINYTLKALSKGEHTIKVFIDKNNDINESNEDNNIFIKDIIVKPSLTIYKPKNWTEEIVIKQDNNCSRFECINNKLEYYENNELFINWHTYNNSNKKIDEEFIVTLYVDDNKIKSYTRPAFEKHRMFTVVNKNIGKLSVGKHTIKLVLDENKNISSSDNIFTKEITILPEKNNSAPILTLKEGIDFGSSTTRSLRVSQEATIKVKIDDIDDDIDKIEVNFDGLSSPEISKNINSNGEYSFSYQFKKSDYVSDSSNFWKKNLKYTITAYDKKGNVSNTIVSDTFTVYDYTQWKQWNDTQEKEIETLEEETQVNETFLSSEIDECKAVKYPTLTNELKPTDQYEPNKYCRHGNTKRSSTHGLNKEIIIDYDINNLAHWSLDNSGCINYPATINGKYKYGSLEGNIEGGIANNYEDKEKLKKYVLARIDNALINKPLTCNKSDLTENLKDSVFWENLLKKELNNNPSKYSNILKLAVNIRNARIKGQSKAIEEYFVSNYELAKSLYEADTLKFISNILNNLENLSKDDLINKLNTAIVSATKFTKEVIDSIPNLGPAIINNQWNIYQVTYFEAYIETSLQIAILENTIMPTGKVKWLKGITKPLFLYKIIILDKLYKAGIKLKYNIFVNLNKYDFNIIYNVINKSTKNDVDLKRFFSFIENGRNIKLARILFTIKKLPSIIPLKSTISKKNDFYKYVKIDGNDLLKPPNITKRKLKYIADGKDGKDDGIDLKGSVTETVMNNYFRKLYPKSEGYIFDEGKTIGNKGFDGVIYKEKDGLITELIILDGKQFKNGVMKVNPESDKQAQQLSNKWIKDKGYEMGNELGIKIMQFMKKQPYGTLEKYVGGLTRKADYPNQSMPEMVIMKLSNNY